MVPLRNPSNYTDYTAIIQPRLSTKVTVRVANASVGRTLLSAAFDVKVDVAVAIDFDL
jgi:hypothetical protein